MIIQTVIYNLIILHSEHSSICLLVPDLVLPTFCISGIHRFPHPYFPYIHVAAFHLTTLHIEVLENHQPYNSQKLVLAVFVYHPQKEHLVLWLPEVSLSLPMTQQPLSYLFQLFFDDEAPSYNL
uniref:Uncharacterized protein n=1 Tax=uncultured marine thaumarchaeote KM3_181_G03 TaxID=1456065 RepID=A0A075GQE4_9ARCH|nr:hypothetical protein [uncultured marine thaumarchaeote KM3_181_G03]